MLAVYRLCLKSKLVAYNHWTRQEQLLHAALHLHKGFSVS